MKLIYDKTLSERRPPENLKEDDKHLFFHEFSKEIRETHVVELESAHVLKDVIVVLREFKVYYEYSHLFRISKISLLKRFSLIFRKGKKVDKGIWIIDKWSKGYFHWLTDALPRFIATVGFIQNYPVLLPNSFKNERYITESLKMLNCSVEFFKETEKLNVRKLVLPSHTARTGNYNEKLIKELRAKFLQQTFKLGERRIFISRQKARKRKISNEFEVIKLLKSFAFEIHFFEEYSFQKQVELMAETKILIGLHGAGLTNMLFMRENGLIMELRNQGDSGNNCYFSLASALDHKYFYQLNDGNQKNTHAADITVNLNELRINLELITAQN